MTQLMPLLVTLSCFSKIQTGFFPFWYRLTRVVLERGPLNGCVCVVLCYVCMKGDLVAVGVLSGNRNFEGRIHPMTRANYLASPPLVIAYALAGTVLIDFDNEPIGESVIVIINNITHTHTCLTALCPGLPG